MGVVYEAFDKERGVTVALKTLRDAHGDAVYRLKREFRALQGVEHPNLVRLYDLFAEGSSCFYTMELIPGRELGAAGGARPVLDAGDATVRDDDTDAERFEHIRQVLDGLCRGLEALHAAGLLHRDLKPSNVMVEDSGRVVLLDFGLVADAHAAAQQTVAGAVAGTVAYMAPEQARGDALELDGGGGPLRARGDPVRAADGHAALSRRALRGVGGQGQRGRTAGEGLRGKRAGRPRRAGRQAAVARSGGAAVAREYSRRARTGEHGPARGQQRHQQPSGARSRGPRR